MESLRDPAFIADPYPTFDRWRQAAPVLARPMRRDYLVTGYAEILVALNDSRLGHRPPGKATISTGGASARDWMLDIVARGATMITAWPSKRNPPDHGHLREPFNAEAASWRTSASAKWLDDSIEKMLGAAVARGGLDVVNDLAFPLTSDLSYDILGIPVSDRAALRPLVRSMEEGIDIDSPDALATKGMAAAGVLDDYLRRLFKDRLGTSSPHASMHRRLADSMVHDQLDLAEASALAALTLLAGAVTTESLISSAVLNLLRYSDDWKDIGGDASLLDLAVEECLRFDAPAQLISRTALADTELGHRRIEAGESVRLLIGAGNRDPHHIEEPNLFDIRRPRRRILSMGAGLHSCPGAGQARHTTRRVLRRMSQLAPAARLVATEPVWRSGFQLRSLAALPVEF